MAEARVSVSLTRIEGVRLNEYMQDLCVFDDVSVSLTRIEGVRPLCVPAPEAEGLGFQYP